MKNAPKPFLVFGLQRSGTTVVAKLLDNQERVKCYGELLLRNESQDECYEVAKKSLSTSRRRIHPFASRIEYLDRLLTDDATCDAIGAKLMFDQTAPPILLCEMSIYQSPITSALVRNFSLERWIRERDVLVIHVIRQNLLKLYVSKLMAQRSGLYHSSEGERQLKSVTVNVHVLQERLRNLDHRQDAAQRFANRFHHVDVTYEASLNESQRAIFSAMNISAEPLAPTLAKMTSDDLHDVISNYEEVQRSLARSKYRRFLES